MREVMGDITKIDHGYIMHQVNCQNVMGAGVAKSLATKYPIILESYHDFCYEHPTAQNRFGSIQEVPINSQLKIFNCFTQLAYGNSKKTGIKYTDEEQLMRALSVFDQTAKNDDMPAYVPGFIGCRLAGGNWDRIRKHILDQTNITIIYKK